MDVGAVHVVIVGGGFGGIAAASQLQALNIPFVLVDMKDSFHHNVAALRASVESGNGLFSGAFFMTVVLSPLWITGWFSPVRARCLNSTVRQIPGNLKVPGLKQLPYQGPRSQSESFSEDLGPRLAL